ncbi:MAG: class B sortase [Clostridiales Family XIII bacterium]|nr:class B sortase [Clostridiales Family XIII bacterium]
MSSSLKRNLLTLGIIVCVIVFALSAYIVVSYISEGKKSEAEFEELRKLPEVKAEESADKYEDIAEKYRILLKRNADFVGWLRVYDTDIDYPVMQTPREQEYYLHRNFDKEYSRAGTLFAAAGGDIGRPSDVIIVYGHKMKNGSMFGKLSKVSDPDFYEGHRFIRFDTLNERRSYLIFCVYKTAVNTGEASEYRYYDRVDFEDEAAFDDFIAEAERRQYFDTGVRATYGDEILLLSTCEGAGDNGRLVAMAKRIPNEEAPEYPKQS